MSIQESEFSWAEAKESANLVLFKNSGKYLSDIEIKVLQGAWQGKTYEKMAQFYGYSPEYLNKDIGNKLWNKLSDALGEKVRKKNFKEALKREWKKHQTLSNFISENISVNQWVTELPFPEGSVALSSSFYLEREGIESLCYETVMKPGSLIRIEAPKLMGKTSLVRRILAYAGNHDYQTVYLDLQNVDKAILKNLDKFLRWLCLKVSYYLKLENQLNEYWDTEILGSNDNCTAYFEEYLLAKINSPLVLAFDNADRILSSAELGEDLFGMLRSWHEKGKIFDLWKQLNLVLAYSTETYTLLDINQSFLNAGVPVYLLEFNLQQIQDLAYLHQLNWNETEIKKLMSLVGGHPYLVRLAMYYIHSEKVSLNQLLKQSTTEVGIYSSHLRRHLDNLQQSTPLAEAFKKVVDSLEPVELDPIKTHKLYSLGLITRQDNQVMPRCGLYREYFQRVLTLK